MVGGGGFVQLELENKLLSKAGNNEDFIYTLELFSPKTSKDLCTK